MQFDEETPKPNIPLLSSKKDVKGLINALRCDDIDIRYDAMDALRKLGELSIAQLCNALKDEDRNVRKCACIVLGDLRNPKAVRELTETLKDVDADVREAAAEALGLIEDKSALNPLLESLKDEHPFVRAQAAISLSDLQVEDSSDYIVSHIISLLNDKEWIVRENAVIALSKFSCEKVHEQIIKMLSDSSEHVVERAIKTLGEMKCKKAVPYLSNMLQSNHPDRKWAAWSLGEIGEGISALVHALKNDSDVEVRRKAATALGKLADIRAIDALEHALFNDEDEVSTRATKALGKIGASTKEDKAKERIENILIKAVKDDHLDVKLNALLGLGNLGKSQNPRTLEVLQNEKDHDIEEIRNAANESLNKIKNYQNKTLSNQNK